MNVLFITHCTPMDGGNRSLLCLMTELMEPPYNITPILITPKEIKNASSNIVTEARTKGITCISTRFYPFKYTSKGIANFIRYASNIINFPVALYKLRKLHIDLIHSNSSIFNLGAFISHVRKRPHVWHLREFGDLDFNLKPLFGARQERKAYRGADRFIAISGKVRQRFISVIPSGKIDVIYNGIAANHDVRIAEHSSPIIRFCIAGALNYAKRQTDAVEAVNILVNQRNIRALHLSILGEGRDRPMLEAMISRYGLESYVSILGWRKNPEAVFEKMDVGLMLSTNEAFGRVTVEYMRSGLLVIASDGGANPEIISEGVNGLLFETGNVNALADKMESVIFAPEMIRRISATALEYANNHFLSSDNTKSVFNLYTQLL